MHDPLSVIMCIVGVIGCVIGVATYASAQLTKAKDDGILMAKVDQVVIGLKELKEDTKNRNVLMDATIDSHGKEIVELKTRMLNVEKEIFGGGRE